MTESLTINVNIADDRPLTPAEIKIQRQVCKNIADGHKWHDVSSRMLCFVMNRAYLRALERGESKRSAEQDAGHAAGVLEGMLLGTFLTLLAVGTLGWIYGLAATAGTVNTIMAVILWIVVFSLGFRAVRRKIVALFKRRKKDKA